MPKNTPVISHVTIPVEEFHTLYSEAELYRSTLIVIREIAQSENGSATEGPWHLSLRLIEIALEASEVTA